jgi:hypothetical protein
MKDIEGDVYVDKGMAKILLNAILGEVDGNKVFDKIKREEDRRIGNLPKSNECKCEVAKPEVAKVEVAVKHCEPKTHREIPFTATYNKHNIRFLVSDNEALMDIDRFYVSVADVVGTNYLKDSFIWKKVFEQAHFIMAPQPYVRVVDYRHMIECSKSADDTCFSKWLHQQWEVVLSLQLYPPVVADDVDEEAESPIKRTQDLGEVFEKVFETKRGNRWFAPIRIVVDMGDVWFNVWDIAHAFNTTNRLDLCLNDSQPGKVIGNVTAYDYYGAYINAERVPSLTGGVVPTGDASRFNSWIEQTRKTMLDKGKING